MSVSENMRSISSLGQIKNPSVRQSHKKTKHSRSSINVASSAIIAPQRDTHPEDGKNVTKAETKSPEVPRECECGPDLYSRVLGPTADETILTGLQTVIDLCNKLRVCGDKEDSCEEEPERDSVLSADSDIPERDTLPHAISQTDSKDSRTSKIQTDSKLIKSSISQTSRSMVSAGFQVNPSVKTEVTQTAAYPDMVSEILQTIGLSPDLASKIVQTSFMSLAEPKKPLPEPKRTSLASIFMQTSNPSLYSGAMQTTDPDLVSGFAQTSTELLPQIISSIMGSQTDSLPKLLNSQTQSHFPSTSEEVMVDNVPRTSTRETMTDDIRPRSGSCRSIRSSLKQSSEHEFKKESTLMTQETAKGDEHKCISPPEPPTKSKSCRCCKCSSSSNLRKESSDSSKNSESRKRCICGHRKTKCKCPVQSNRSITSTSGDKESPQEVKYAVTKISKYKEFTTFEMMKSTKKEPKRMPKCIEGVFVLKKNKGKEKEKSKDNEKEASKA